MDQLLTGLEGYTAAFLDDLVIYINSWTVHLEHVQRVLMRLREAGLTVKTKKRQFGTKECVYLGHVVGNGTVNMASWRRFRALQSPRQSLKCGPS